MAQIDSSALDRLRTVLSPSASVNLPGDPDYSNKRWALNAERQAVIVACPATAEDVAQILAFSQGRAPYTAQQKLDLAIKVVCNHSSLIRVLIKCPSNRVADTPRQVPQAPMAVLLSTCSPRCIMFVLTQRQSLRTLVEDLFGLTLMRQPPNTVSNLSAP
jgi:hypothetical protein